MSDKDAERKAKAARAKKLLAARQKEKAKAIASTPLSPTSTVQDSAAPSVRTSLSLDGSVRGEEKKEDGGEEPTPTAPPSDSLATLQETVSLLIKERTDLQGQVSELQRQLATARGDTQLLDEGRVLISRLEEEKRDLESKLDRAKETSLEVERLQDESMRLNVELEGLRDGKRDLERVLVEVHGEAEEGRKKDRDAISELEKSVNRARERESGLEGEIARLRQSHSELSSSIDTITIERDQLRSSSSADSSTLGELRQSHKSLQAEHDTLRSEHTSLQEAHTTLQTSHNALASEHSEASSSRKTLDGDLTKEREEAARIRGQLEESQGKVDASTKRAEAVERKRTALQEENAELVKQLEEVRGRVVQVLDEKMDLAAKLEEWERRPKVDPRVAELETELEARSNGPLSPPTDDSVSTLRSAHTLELSRQAEQIRHLEASLHASTSRVHSLSRELFEAQRGDGPKSPTLESKQFSVDSLLPANVRHKRQVSLAALKARMDHSTKMDKVTEEAPSPRLEHSLGNVRKQFGDEIVFCCPACDGDLITV